jgi:hypothetical protein
MRSCRIAGAAADRGFRNDTGEAIDMIDAIEPAPAIVHALVTRGRDSPDALVETKTAEPARTAHVCS